MNIIRMEILLPSYGHIYLFNYVQIIKFKMIDLF